MQYLHNLIKKSMHRKNYAMYSLLIIDNKNAKKNIYQ